MFFKHKNIMILCFLKSTVFGNAPVLAPTQGCGVGRSGGKLRFFGNQPVGPMNQPVSKWDYLVHRAQSCPRQRLEGLRSASALFHRVPLRRYPHTAGTQAASLLWALSWMLKPSENVWVCGMFRVTRSYRYVESWESLASSPSPQQLSAHLSPLIFLFLSRILLGLGVARGSEDGVLWPVTQLHLGCQLWPNRFSVTCNRCGSSG